MKLAIIFICCFVALVAAQVTNPSNPIPTNYPVGSMRRALSDGTIADVCQQFTGFSKDLLYKNQNCDFPPDDEASGKFKHCYIGFFFNGTSQEDQCLDMNLVAFLSTPDQLTLVEKCSKEYLPKCCKASCEERNVECADFMNCYTYCALDCADKCPVNFTLDASKKRSRY